MKVTGSINSVLQSVKMSSAEPAESYFEVARRMMPGLRALAVASPNSPFAMSFVASHMLECILKAYLTKSGITQKILREDTVRHNLAALWDMAVEKGLKIPISPPEWVCHLNCLHDKPFPLRYLERLNGVITPLPEPMTSELEDLIETVAKRL